MNFQEVKKELLPILEKAEEKRKVYRRYKLISTLFLQLFFLAIIIVPVAMYLFNSQFVAWVGTLPKNTISGFPIQFAMLFFWGAFIVVIVISNNRKREYRNLEGEILSKLIKKIAPSFRYYQHRQISSEALKKSELLTKYNPFIKNKKQETIYNLNQGVLLGKVDSTDITMGNVKTVETNYGSYLMFLPILAHLYLAYEHLKPWFKKEASIEQIGGSFVGMFAFVDFPKSFKGTTVVLPDQYEKKLGYLAKNIQSINFKRDELVNLEDVAFENEFVVYSTDQVEARYLLSPSLMERISNFKRKIKSPISLSFKDNKLYIAVTMPHGFLSLRTNENLITSNALELFYDDITTAIGIVEDLNLNTKIWG
ncbi:DUF3137 domain-containing protein [Muricauda sp. JGD-17]|uniref:DUF3137 domain-containing protein n=1 Tax=Flagellimonas ochracea TaxID=2696472 RepID=A0A964TDT0_9FLAO|nr:DUF3137 domain-containing protein [Allomuricauda ochracea]NAY93075.1 DUF3137 domain-containing protein [Allomuricauda ochracea]